MVQIREFWKFFLFKLWNNKISLIHYSHIPNSFRVVRPSHCKQQTSSSSSSLYQKAPRRLQFRRHLATQLTCHDTKIFPGIYQKSVTRSKIIPSSTTIAVQETRSFLALHQTNFFLRKTTEFQLLSDSYFGS